MSYDLLGIYSKILLDDSMRLFWKVFFIVSVLGFFIPIFENPIFLLQWIVLGNIFYFITSPIRGITAIFVMPYVAVPYYAITLSLLYWWEKKKSKSEVKNLS